MGRVGMGHLRDGLSQRSRAATSRSTPTPNSQESTGGGAGDVERLSRSEPRRRGKALQRGSPTRQRRPRPIRRRHPSRSAARHVAGVVRHEGGGLGSHASRRPDTPSHPFPGVCWVAKKRCDTGYLRLTVGPSTARSPEPAKQLKCCPDGELLRQRSSLSG